MEPRQRATDRGSRLSAGVVVLRRFEDGWRVLVLRVFRYWDFPKGLVEHGEAALDAARREVAEETGLTDLAFRWGTAHCDTEPYAGGKVARYFLAASSAGEARLPVDPALGRPEHHALAWLPIPVARTRLVPRLQRVLDWAAARVQSNP